MMEEELILPSSPAFGRKNESSCDSNQDSSSELVATVEEVAAEASTVIKPASGRIVKNSVTRIFGNRRKGRPSKIIVRPSETIRLSPDALEFVSTMSAKSIPELAGERYDELSMITPPPSSVTVEAPIANALKTAFRKPAGSLLTGEHHMAAIMFWKLSKHKLTDFENSASRKNSEKPQKNLRYEFVCQKFKEQYNGLEPPSYALLHDKLKLYKEKKPMTNYETRSKFVQEQSLQKVRKALELVPSNSVISTWQISKKVSLSISTVEKCLEKETDLVTKRVHYFKKAGMQNALSNITNQNPGTSNDHVHSKSSCDLSKFAQFSALEKHTYLQIFEATEKRFPHEYRKRELIDIAGAVFKNKFNRQPPKVTSVFKMFKRAKASEPLVKERKREYKKPSDKYFEVIKDALIKSDGLISARDMSRKLNINAKAIRNVIRRHDELKQLVKAGHPMLRIRNYDYHKELIRQMLINNSGKVTKAEICDSIGIGVMCLYKWMRKDPELAQWLGYNQQTTSQAQFSAAASEKSRKGKAATKRKASTSDEVEVVVGIESTLPSTADGSCLMMALTGQPQVYQTPMETTHQVQQSEGYSGVPDYPPNYTNPSTQYYSI